MLSRIIIFGMREGGRALVVVSAGLWLSQPASAQSLYTLGSHMAVSVLDLEHERNLDCIAQAIVYEAGREPLEGQQAVAQVIMNRSRAAPYPKTACGVVYQGSHRRTGCQFTFTCDGALARRMPERMFLAARAVAESALDGTLPNRVGDATHYHADYVLPYWAARLERVGQIGAHIFYRPGVGQRSQRDALSPDLMQVAGRVDGSSPSGAPRPFSPWGLTLTMAASARVVD